MPTVYLVFCRLPKSQLSMHVYKNCNRPRAAKILGYYGKSCKHASIHDCQLRPVGYSASRKVNSAIDRILIIFKPGSDKKNEKGQG